MIVDLLSSNQTNYVQTFGYELRGSNFSSTRLNLINKKLIVSPNFEKLLEILGEDIMNMILYNFYVKILQKNKNFISFVIDFFKIERGIFAIGWT